MTAAQAITCDEPSPQDSSPLQTYGQKESTPDAELLTVCVLNMELLPARADADVADIALATVQKMDTLPTWICRHVSNAASVGQTRGLMCARGRTLAEDYAPEDLK